MPAGRYHIIINLKDVEEHLLTDQEGLKKILSELPVKIDMSVLYPPVVCEGIPENPGLSGFVVIDFSHISIHTFTAHKQVLVDIFSCKSYDQEVAIAAVITYFQIPRSSAQIQQVAWGE